MTFYDILWHHVTFYDILINISWPSRDITWHFNYITWHFLTSRNMTQDISCHHVTCLLSLHTIIKNLDVEEVNGNMVVEICIFTSWGNMHILAAIFPDSPSTSGFSMIAWWIWMSHDVMKCHEMELNLLSQHQITQHHITQLSNDITRHFNYIISHFMTSRDIVWHSI